MEVVMAQRNGLERQIKNWRLEESNGSQDKTDSNMDRLRLATCQTSCFSECEQTQ